MSPRAHIILSCIAIAIQISAGPAGAGSVPDAFPPANAYSVGMGATGVGLRNDASSIYWNPAGVGTIRLLSTAFTVAAPTAEMPDSWSFVMANSSSEEGSRFGLGMFRRSAHIGDDSYKSFQVNLPLSFGIKAGEVPIGVTLKYITERYGESELHSGDSSEWHSGYAIDAGAMWASSSGITVGLSALNFVGSALRAFQSKTWLGTSWRNYDETVIISAQARVDRPLASNQLERNFGFGFSIIPGDGNFGMRGGFARQEQDGWLTAGFRYYNPKSNSFWDYSMAVNPDGWTNRAHFVTYGYSLKAQPTKSPMGGARNPF